MKKILFTVCLIFTFVILIAGNPPEQIKEKSNVNYPYTSYQFMNTAKNFIYPEWGFYIDESTGYSKLNNKNLSSDMWNNKGGFGFTFDAGVFRSITPTFRILAGLGISYYTTILEANGDIFAQKLKDIDNDTYNETLTLSEVKNTVNPIYLSVPLVFEFGNINIKSTGFYIDAGLKYSFLLINNYQTTGSYSAKGTYEQWGLTLENIEELGFYSNREMESSSDFNKSNISLLGGIGISVPISSAVILKFGIKGSFGLMDIGNNKLEKPAESPLTVETFNFRANHINNTLAVTKDTKTRYIGFEFGIYINKRLK